MKYKIRRIVCLLLLIVFSLGVTTVKNESKFTLKSNNLTEDISVVVQNGDTIWDIVESYYNDINKPFYADKRYVVNYVSDYNNGSDLKIGQTILIPKDIK